VRPEGLGKFKKLPIYIYSYIHALFSTVRVTETRRPNNHATQREHTMRYYSFHGNLWKKANWSRNVKWIVSKTGFYDE
jgi:hypothetical protein